MKPQCRQPVISPVSWDLSAALALNSLISVTTNVTGSFASLNGTAVTRPWIAGGMLLQMGE